jgi:hypothetical protein
LKQDTPFKRAPDETINAYGRPNFGWLDYQFLMVNDSDADRIQREKDRRRAEERLRIEREHHRRLHEVEVLRRSSPHPGSDPPDRALSDSRPLNASVGTRPDRPPPSPPDAPIVTAPEPAGAVSDSISKPGPAHRPIGKPVQSAVMSTFLALDPAEQFDIIALNQIPLAPLLHEGTGDPDLLALIASRTEALMDRVKREVDDPLTAGALLRDFALKWYRLSLLDAAWGEIMQDRWGGIFAESKVSGGKLHPWLNMRLWAVHQNAIRDGGLGLRVRRGLSRSRTAEAAVSRTASQQIQAEVAQALVDDLGARPRNSDGSLPLIRLSELAVRRQVATVNEALATLFNSSETGPFVVLHPNRYPDCEELQIRPPSGGASGAALAFTLVTPRGTRRTGSRIPLSDALSALDSGNTREPSGGGEEVDPAAIWDAKAMSAATWRSVLEESHREKHRLDAPPRDYRSRPSYASLRDLLLRDSDIRKAFLAVKWRGRPAGLPLLASLLQKGTIAPEVATDHEYLEAELGELSAGDPQFVPSEGTWKFTGWSVVREGTHREGFRYRAVPDPTDASSSR